MDFINIPESVINAQYPSKYYDVGRIQAQNNEIIGYDKLYGAEDFYDTKEQHDIVSAPTNRTVPEHQIEEIYHHPTDWDYIESKELCDRLRGPYKDVLNLNDADYSGQTQYDTQVSFANDQHSSGDYFFTQSTGFLPVRDYTKDYVSDIEYVREEPTLMHNDAVRLDYIQVENSQR